LKRCGGPHLDAAHPLGLLGELGTEGVLGLGGAQHVVIQLLVQVGGRLRAWGGQIARNTMLSLVTSTDLTAVVQVIRKPSDARYMNIVIQKTIEGLTVEDAQF
jgi:hypothetical protein